MANKDIIWGTSLNRLFHDISIWTCNNTIMEQLEQLYNYVINIVTFFWISYKIIFINLYNKCSSYSEFFFYQLNSHKHILYYGTTGTVLRSSYILSLLLIIIIHIHYYHLYAEQLWNIRMMLKVLFYNWFSKTK